jgi:hypothetical protein
MVAMSRAMVEAQLDSAKKEAAERHALIEEDRRRWRETEERLIADRPHFSVIQSRADALKEKAELLERIKKEKKILAAIRFLDQRDAEAAAEERNRATRARLLVADASRGAVASKRTDDVQLLVAETRQQRNQRGRDEAAAVEARLEQNRALRDQHAQAMIEQRELQIAKAEERLIELQAALKSSEDDAARQLASDQRATQRRLDEAAVLEQQRLECKVALMRHERNEEGHLLKSPVKSPLPIRHLPPIKHDHTRVMHQQASLLLLHLRSLGAAPGGELEATASSPVKLRPIDTPIASPVRQVAPKAPSAAASPTSPHPRPAAAEQGRVANDV